MSNRTETFFNVSPLISGFLIASGITRASLYFSVFGIRILPFLDFGETLLLITDSFIKLILAMLFLGSMFYITSFRSIINRGRFDGFGWETPIIILHSLVILILLGYLYFSTLPLSYKIIQALNYFAITTGLYLLINLVFSIKNKFEFQFYTKVSGSLTFTLTSGIAIFILLSITGLSEGASIKHLPDYRKQCVAFLENNRKIQTNDSIFYVGRTQNYVFFYNLKSNMKTVIPTSNIKEFKIQ